MSFFNNLKKKVTKNIESLIADNYLGKTIPSSITNRMNSMFEVYSLTELLPYRAYNEENELYYNESSKGFILSSSPMSGADLADDLPFYNLLQRILPEGAIIQGLLQASSKIGDSLDEFAKARLGQGAVLEQMSASRAEHFKKGALNSLLQTEDYLLRDFRLYLSVSFDNELELTDAYICNIRIKLIRALYSIKVRAKKVSPTEFLQLIDELLCPKLDIYPNDNTWSYLEPLNKQIGSGINNFKATSQRIAVNDNWDIATFSVEKYPSKPIFLCQMGDYIGDLFDETKRLGCPFTLSFVVRVLKQAPEQKAIHARAAIAKQRAKQEGAKSELALKEAKFWQDFLNLVEKKERVVDSIFNITLYAPKDTLTEHESNLESIFQPNNSPVWKLKKNYFLHLPTLIASLPLAQTNSLMDDLARLKLSKKMWAENAANTFPVIAEIKGHLSKRIMVGQRRGQLLFWDPFDSPNNFNTAIAGDSGSGKSVMVNEIVSSMVGTGGQCFVVDIGKSYIKLCNLLGGTFLQFKGADLCLNPFSNANFADQEETQEFVEFMTVLVTAMADPNEKNIDTLGQSFITQAIQAVIEKKGNQAEIQDIVELLAKHQDCRVNDLAVMLTPYTKTGVYGRYFNGTANVDLSNRLVVFELEGVNRRLRSVIFKIIMYQVTLKMYLGNRERQIGFVIDEAWDLMDDTTGVKAAEHAARRARKYKGCLITATQSIADFFTKEAARAIYKQSYWTLMLMQKNTSIEEAVDNKHLKLTDFQKRWFQSVKTQKGEYSEILIQGGGGEMAVGKLLLDPYSLTVYSSEASDNVAINKLCAEGMELSKAIAVVAKKYGVINES